MIVPLVVNEDVSLLGSSTVYICATHLRRTLFHSLCVQTVGIIYHLYRAAHVIRYLRHN